MDEQINKIMDIMDSIEYGFKDENGKNLMDLGMEKWNESFPEIYHLQTPEELIKSKCGVCWDQVELERKLFQDYNISCKTYFIFIVDNEYLPSHTFLVYEMDNKFYWFEHSWEKYKGIYEYNSELELLLDIKEKFKEYHNLLKEDLEFYVYEYQKPKNHITCDEFYQFVENERIVLSNGGYYEGK